MSEIIMSETENLIELDATRLLCPMPVIRLQNKIKTVLPGSRILVRCTDPGTMHDIPTWCRLFEHTLLRVEESNDEILFYIQV